MVNVACASVCVLLCLCASRLFTSAPVPTFCCLFGWVRAGLGSSWSVHCPVETFSIHCDRKEASLRTSIEVVLPIPNECVHSTSQPANQPANRPTGYSWKQSKNARSMSTPFFRFPGTAQQQIIVVTMVVNNEMKLIRCNESNQVLCTLRHHRPVL